MQHGCHKKFPFPALPVYAVPVSPVAGSNSATLFDSLYCPHRAGGRHLYTAQPCGVRRYLYPRPYPRLKFCFALHCAGKSFQALTVPLRLAIAPRSVSACRFAYSVQVDLSYFAYAGLSPVGATQLGAIRRSCTHTPLPFSAGCIANKKAPRITAKRFIFGCWVLKRTALIP